MRTIVITIGLPASGKSFWAKDQLKREPGRWKRFNKDDLRSMIDDGVYSPANEELVSKAQESLVRMAIRDGYDVILDNTHLVQPTKNRIHKLAASIGDITVMEKLFPTPMNVCIERNAVRTGRARVPDEVIPRMARASKIDKYGYKNFKDSQTYYEPVQVASGEQGSIVQDDSFPKAIICDLDGTLAIMGKRSPYDASRCDVVDLPNWPVIKTVLAMHYQGVQVIFMSGRENKHREPTIRFIEKYCNLRELRSEYSPDPIGYELHMRSSGDQRKDAIIKRELYDANIAGKYNVLFVLDDRNQVVRGWRQMGLTVFQVAPGDF